MLADLMENEEGIRKEIKWDVKSFSEIHIEKTE